MQTRTYIAVPIAPRTDRLPNPQTHRSPRAPAICKDPFRPPPAKAAHAPPAPPSVPSPARAPAPAPARLLLANRASASPAEAPGARPVSPSSPCPILTTGSFARSEFPLPAISDPPSAPAYLTREPTVIRGSAPPALVTSHSRRRSAPPAPTGP